MKQNTSRALLWLYPTTVQREKLIFDRLVPIEELKLVLPDVSEGSLRSLLFLMNKNGLIKILNLDSQRQALITKEGMTQLEAQFPALQLGWRAIDRWIFIIFLEPPKTDKNFRYLRRFLLDKKIIQLTRGVYLSPLALDNQTMHLLESLYRGNVLAATADTFLFSDVMQIISLRINLSDTLSLLSGVSREISQLIGLEDRQKGFTDKQKEQIASIFNRLFSLLEQGFCLEKYFFTQARSTLELLADLKKLL